MVEENNSLSLYPYVSLVHRSVVFKIFLFIYFFLNYICSIHLHVSTIHNIVFKSWIQECNNNCGKKLRSRDGIIQHLKRCGSGRIITDPLKKVCIDCLNFYIYQKKFPWKFKQSIQTFFKGSVMFLPLPYLFKCWIMPSLLRNFLLQWLCLVDYYFNYF